MELSSNMSFYFDVAYCTRCQVVCVSWLTLCVQFLTMVSLTCFYQIDKFATPFAKLRNQWRADCRSLQLVFVAMRPAHFACVIAVKLIDAIALAKAYYLVVADMLNAMKSCPVTCAARNYPTACHCGVTQGIAPNVRRLGT